MKDGVPISGVGTVGSTCLENVHYDLILWKSGLQGSGSGTITLSNGRDATGLLYKRYDLKLSNGAILNLFTTKLLSPDPTLQVRTIGLNAGLSPEA